MSNVHSNVWYTYGLRIVALVRSSTHTEVKANTIFARRFTSSALTRIWITEQSLISRHTRSFFYQSIAFSFCSTLCRCCFLNVYIWTFRICKEMVCIGMFDYSNITMGFVSLCTPHPMTKYSHSYALQETSIMTRGGWDAYKNSKGLLNIHMSQANTGFFFGLQR